MKNLSPIDEAADLLTRGCFSVTSTAGSLVIKASGTAAITIPGSSLVTAIGTNAVQNANTATTATNVSGSGTVQAASGTISGQLAVSTLKIGNAILSWDSTAGMLKINAGMYASGAVSSGGVGSSGGGTGSGLTVKSYANVTAYGTTEDLTDVASAYACKRIYDEATAAHSAATSALNSLSMVRNGSNGFTALTIDWNNGQSAISFKGAYDGSTTPTLATLSAMSGGGLRIDADLYVPNGRHIYTYDYGGNLVPVAFYANGNYDYLQLAGCLHVKGTVVDVAGSLTINGKSVTPSVAIDLTTLMASADGATISATAQVNVISTLLDALTAGTACPYILQNVTLGSRTYAIRYPVTAYKRGSANIGLYYDYSENNGTFTRRWCNVSYSSAWKVNTGQFTIQHQ